MSFCSMRESLVEPGSSGSGRTITPDRIVSALLKSTGGERRECHPAAMRPCKACLVAYIHLESVPVLCPMCAKVTKIRHG